MDSKRIEELMEKYWNCETSLEEEQELRSYFKGSDIPMQMNDAADLFRYFENERQRSLADNFDGEVMKAVKKTERDTKVVSMVRWMQVGRIAAGVFVVVAASYFVNKEIQKKDNGDITDPKVALEETKKAFMMISKSLNKARDGAGKINLFNEAEQKISGKEKEKKTEPEDTNI